ncbi:thioesterase II family protein [Nocardiopsis listeri]|uniref:thioesterase II family protein n=1 Tax=Nocardiopsis listeri TaxID=53440 RepID=UPI00083452BC|nr:alpha/beta fold hydrolase [Nocardiopsis listeri]
MHHTGSVSDTWLRKYHPSPEHRTRLFCFPHAGGAASAYFALSQALGPTVEVSAVQYPGRQDRRLEACVEDLSVLADRAFQAVAASVDGPVALLGHSMGAVVAYEVARRLQQKEGITPVHLFVSARRAPSRHRQEDVRLRGDNGIIAEMRRLGGTDQSFLTDPDLRAMILPTLRADYTAVETYSWHPSELLACPVTAMVGTSDPYATADEVSSWRSHTSADFTMHEFPGGHFFLDACLSSVVRIILSSLDGETGGKTHGLVTPGDNARSTPNSR